MSATARHALVIYESMFGNTERIARAVTRGLRASGYDVTCTEVGSFATDGSPDVGLLVLGAPTHAFSLSRARTRADAVRQGAPTGRAAIGMRDWLAAWNPAPSAQTPRVAIFDTRVSKVRRLPAAAGPKAANLVRRRGLRIVGKPVAFLVDDVQGPLCAGEEERAERWAETLADATQHGAVKDALT